MGSFPKMSLSDFLSNLKAKLSRKQISDKPLVPSARKKIRRSQKKLKKFESINEYDNLRKSNSLDGPTKLCVSELHNKIPDRVKDSGDYERIYRQYYKPIPVRSSSKVKNNDDEYKPNDIQEIKHHLVKFEDLISDLIDQHCQQVEHMKLIVKRIDKGENKKKDQKPKNNRTKSRVKSSSLWSNEPF